jgi:hypothetical protein
LKIRGNPNRAAAVAVFAVGVYLQIVEWIDLFPWNDVRSGNGQELLDIILAGATLLLVITLWFGGRWAAVLSSIAIIVWAWLQLSTWWIPYWLGASDGWKRVHSNWFSETIQILPRTENQLPPDANHLVLHVLILVALVSSIRAVFVRVEAQNMNRLSTNTQQ